MCNIHLLLVAAGASKRMGRSKQLLAWGAQTLIEHQLHNLLKTKKKVSVVLGAYAKEIVPVIDALPASIYINKHWENGMGTSIAYGVQQIIKKDPTVDGILISLIDQPLLTTTHFNKLLNAYTSGTKQIIVSQADNNWSGAPVLFDRIYIDELLRLAGDKGAKMVANSHKDAIQFIAGNNLLIDMDTPEIYQELLAKLVN